MPLSVTKHAFTGSSPSRLPHLLRGLPPLCRPSPGLIKSGGPAQLSARDRIADMGALIDIAEPTDGMAVLVLGTAGHLGQSGRKQD
jgi:hypothetical protein